jgi:hypothetical protein
LSKIINCSHKNNYKTGVNVMITFFGGKNGVFLKNNVMVIFLTKYPAVISAKSPIFRRKYFLNHNTFGWTRNSF